MATVKVRAGRRCQNGQTGCVIAVKKEDGRAGDRGGRAGFDVLAVLAVLEMPSSRCSSSSDDVEKKVWQPLGFGDKGLSEALKRLKVEGSRPDCRCLRSAGATVAMSRPRLHAQLGFLALGVFLRLPSLAICAFRAHYPHAPPSLLCCCCCRCRHSPLICASPTPALLLNSHTHTHPHPRPHPHIHSSPWIWVVEVIRPVSQSSSQASRASVRSTHGQARPHASPCNRT